MMVLIVLTDGQPVAALRRLYSRVGFILLPFSIALIRYTDLGRGYTPDGAPENTGVTTNKNSLGLIVFIVSLGALWNMRALLIDKEAPNRTRRLTGSSHPAYLWHCASANVPLCHRCRLLHSRRRAHACDQSACYQKAAQQGVRAVFGSRSCGGLGMLFGGDSALSSALGRGNGLSGRTEIWAAAIAAAGNPIIGTGFESFWNANVDKVARGLAQAIGTFIISSRRTMVT